jgi:Aspartyl protease
MGGPILSGYIGVSQARASALIAAGQAVPNPVQIRGLVDTGASGTCVDPSVLTTLGLTPTGSITVNTPSTGSQPHVADQYDVSLMIPGSLPTHPPLSIGNLPVLCSELLAQQGFHALIGRDILSICLLSYNGPAGFFTLAY